MQLTKRQVTQLIRIIETTQQLLTEASRLPKGASTRSAAGRQGGARRRTGQELAAFRKMIKAERKSGVAVAELARKHGVTPSYIYQI